MFPDCFEPAPVVVYSALAGRSVLTVPLALADYSALAGPLDAAGYSALAGPLDAAGYSTLAGPLVPADRSALAGRSALADLPVAGYLQPVSGYFHLPLFYQLSLLNHLRKNHLR